MHLVLSSPEYDPLARNPWILIGFPSLSKGESLKKFLICAAAVLPALGMAAAVGGQTGREGATLQAELDALLGEILESVEVPRS